ncbi:sodium:glutamate symporter [Corynebacterium sp. TAE3-ERU12]|uniref:sodium/glutamate symporter n=1 Tax=Corynebacterium sp. TAE3-ERU12 TaxID=2849491 RepID=UPI001C471658|nr:sodium/glutamate symporter [Corynebacterium sp. TAE3-ERU12]MBV7295497.1 sodium:glutamate symporter [Corynebacterium sp. TAE3-ERU12]
MTPNSVGLALLLLGLFLLVGKFIRMRVRWVQNLFLPSAIVAGFIALALGPDVFGQIMALFGNDSFTESGLLGADTLEVWKSLPGLLISVVFATLFLGQKLPGPRTVVDLAGPQLSVGVAFASGQYVIGLLLAVLVLAPFFGIPEMAGALIEIGFEGGHGTAAGMIPVFEEVGWSDGADLAIGVATIGLVGGIVIGVGVINWAIRTGRTEVVTDVYEQSLAEQRGLFGKDEQYTAGSLTSRPSSIEPLSLHMSFVALAIIIGVGLLEFLQWVEQMLWADKVELLAYVPLFPLAMLGGIFLQIAMNKLGIGHLVDPGLMMRIQGFALDVLVVAALATISLQAIAANFWAFLILCVGGIAVNLFLLLWMVPRTIPSFWLERGIGDFGQSMGVTATGLILMRIVDPEGKSPCFEAFGYKQLVFEPFFGGGLITAIAIPLIYQFGPYPLLVGMGVLFIGSLVTGLFYWGRKTSDDAALRHADVTPDHVGPGDGVSSTA